MIRIAVVAVTAVLLSVPAEANCRLNLRAAGGDGTAPLRLEWDAVQGAEHYEILEWRGANTATFYRTSDREFAITRRASKPTVVRYEVVARLATGVRSAGVIAAGEPNDSCSEELDVRIPADEEFRTFTRRAIVAIAGSLPANGGGFFRTSLEMKRNASEQRGRLVFRPAGTTPSATDPSIPYRLDETVSYLYWADVVNAMGGTGVGSIEIIPDEGSEERIPVTRVRTFHQDANGARGSYDSPVEPFDHLRPSAMTVLMPPQTSRVNVGFRALRPATTKALVFGADGRLRLIRDLGLPANVSSLTAVDQLLSERLLPGETVQFLTSEGVISFYTVTDNGSGDTAVFMAPATRQTLDVGDYIE